MDDIVYSVSDFVAVFNQTISYAYSSVLIEGEIDNLRVRKGQWVYFSLRDELANVNFFGSVNQLPGPLENGIRLRVRGFPFLHPIYGFSVNVQFAQPVGEGSINRASQLLEAKLTKEGLFEVSRKRLIPYPPKRVGLIASYESAAYHDFLKIITDRWAGLEIIAADVGVQGDLAQEHIVKAIGDFNLQSEPVDVLVITRGGGSQSDLAVFNQEQIVRAVAGSRIPTLVAIGHEIDVTLAEKAADQRGATPSNAAELLTPDKKQLIRELSDDRLLLNQLASNLNQSFKNTIEENRTDLRNNFIRLIEHKEAEIVRQKQLLNALDPKQTLHRGFAIVRKEGKVVKSAKYLKSADLISVEFSEGGVDSRIEKVKR